MAFTKIGHPVYDAISNDTNPVILQPNELPNVAYYYNANDQLYLNTQGTHSNLEMTDVGAARSDDATQH